MTHSRATTRSMPIEYMVHDSMASVRMKSILNEGGDCFSANNEREEEERQKAEA